MRDLYREAVSAEAVSFTQGLFHVKQTVPQRNRQSFM